MINLSATLISIIYPFSALILLLIAGIVFFLWKNKRVNESLNIKQKELEILSSSNDNLSKRLIAHEDITNIGTFTFYVEKNELSWSHQLFRIYDLPEDSEPLAELEQKEYMSEDDWEKMKTMMRESFLDSTIREYNYSITTKKGKTKRIHCRYLWHKNEKGHFYKLTGAIMDISEFLHSEQKTASYEMIKQALSSSEILIWEVNFETNHIYLNRNWDTLYERQTPDLSLTLDELNKLVHPDDYERAWKDLNDHLAGKTDIYISEYRTKFANSEYRWVVSRGKIYEFDAEGKPVKMGGTIYDISRRKEIERKLLDSEKNIRLLTENAADIIFQFKVDTQEYSFISKAVEKMTGYTQEDFYDNPAFLISIVHPDWKTFFQNQNRNLINGTMPETLEFPIIHKNGETRWVLQKSYFAKDDNGKIIMLEGIVSDITNYKQLLQEIKHEKDFISAILNTVDALIIALNPRGEIVIFNKACQKITGYSQEEVFGKKIWDVLLYEEEKNAVMGVFANLKINQLTNEFDNNWKAKSGDKILIHWSNGVLLDDDGNLQLVLGTGIDITEKSEVQQLAFERQNFINKIAELMPAVLFIFDMQKRKFVYANSKIEDLVGLPLQQIVSDEGFDFDSLYYGGRDDEYYKHIEMNQNAKDGEIIQHEYKFKGPEGEVVWIESLESVFKRDDEGNVQQTIGIAQDISSRKEAEKVMIGKIESLTKPADDNDVTLTDLFNIDDLQKIQDAFADATGVASIITYPDGTPITKPSNFCTLCNDIIRKTEKGLKNCMKSDAHIGQYSVTGPTILPCLSGGLWDSGASISIGEKHIANWLIGQVRTNTSTDEEMLKYAEEIGADPVEYANALKKVNTMPYEQFESISNMLFILAKKLSESAYNNLNQARAIHTQRITSDALKESEKRYRDLVDQAPIAIMIFLQEDILFLNKKAIETLGGHSIDEFVDKTMKAFMHDAYFNMIMEYVNNARISGLPSQISEMRFEKLNGQRIYAEVIASSIDYRGKKSGQIIFYDITRRKNTETEKKKLEQQLHQAQKMESIGMLAGGVAHDFNNLLTPIIGYSEIMMADKSLPEKYKTKIDNIQKAADRARELTWQLLAFGRKQVLKVTEENLNDLIEEFLKIIRRTIREDIEIIFDPSPDIGMIKIDRSQVSQILMNLAVNSQDALPDGGLITIETMNINVDYDYSKKQTENISPGRYVMLAFSDTGKGMDDKTTKHIFEPFFTTKEINKGTGLGLATVYGIMKQHKGSIWVYSEPNHGTTFKLIFPRIEKSEILQSVQAAPKIKLDGTETIIVVEDNQLAREMTINVLAKRGYNIISCEDSMTCISQIKDIKNPDLLITDVVMPGMNGKKLYENMKKVYPDIKVLYMSGYTDNVVAHHGILDNDINFIQKPFAVRELLELIRNILDEE